MGKVFGMQLFFVLQYCSWPLEYISRADSMCLLFYIGLIKDLVFPLNAVLQDVAVHAMAIV